MKTLRLLATAAALVCASCAPLAGTSLVIGEDGSAVIHPPEAIVIPAK